MTAPAVLIAPSVKQRFFDATGIPLAGGKLFTYLAGSTTKQNTYTDSTGGTPNANPVILDSAGYCNLWLDQTLLYKFTLAPATDTDPPTNPIWTVDNLNGPNSPIAASFAASSGSSLIGWIQAGVGAIARWVQDKLRERVSVFDFMDATTVANIRLKTAAGLAAQNPTTVQTAIQTAIESLFNSTDGEYIGALYFPSGWYAVAGRMQLSVNGGCRGFAFYGDGPRTSVFYNYNNTGQNTVEIGIFGNDCYDVDIHGLGIDTPSAGATGNYQGWRIANTHQSKIGNLRAGITSGMQGHGFNISNCFQTKWGPLIARRCGNYGGGWVGTTPGGIYPYGVAGVYVSGNVGHRFGEVLCEENDTGVICDAGGFEFHKLDTEANVHGGLKTVNGGNLIAVDCYQEQQELNAPSPPNTSHVSDDNWYCSWDGTELSTAQFTRHSFGNNGKVIFTNCPNYNFRDPYFGYPLNCIVVTDPGTSRGYIDPLYSNALESVTSLYGYYSQHEAAASHSGNLIQNGSFESAINVESGASGVPGWTYLVGGGAPPSAGSLTPVVDSCGSDLGVRCLKLVRTSGASSFPLGVSANITRGTPIAALKPKRFYTVEFSYKSDTLNALHLFVATNGVTHWSGAGGLPLPVAAVWTRYRNVIEVQGTGSLDRFDIALVENGTAYIDAVCLWEGIKDENFSFQKDDHGLEVAHFNNCLVDDDVSIHANSTDYSGSPAPATQPDVPRSLAFTTDAGWTNASVAIIGYDSLGRYTTESVNMGPGINTAIQTLNTWVRVVSMTSPAQAGNLKIGRGHILGLPKSAVGIIKVKKNTLDATGQVFNIGYNTVNMTAITGADSYTIWYQH